MSSLIAASSGTVWSTKYLSAHAEAPAVSISESGRHFYLLHLIPGLCPVTLAH
jgi:hypothetical protein